MVSHQRRRAAVRRTLYAAMQWAFMFIVIIIFAVAILVQFGTIKLPPWAKAFDGVSEEVHAQYAGAMMSSVCVVFVLFLVVGVTQMVRQAREDARDRTRAVETAA
ncbi:hypothetical protein F4779DRAFT_619086 [Xylariaceae sp. FL0662B]|nr:hypothetical protein F4779DRAFT_619086 [Xylariaceae sp. FL0662B]